MDRQEAAAKFRELQSECASLINKITELEMDRNEHRSVMMCFGARLRVRSKSRTRLICFVSISLRSCVLLFMQTCGRNFNTAG